MDAKTRGCSRSRFAVVLVLLAGATAAVGCGDDADSGSISSQPVPVPLVALEERAEDIIDQVPKARWARIGSDVVVVRRAWDRYGADARAVDPGLARRLDGAVRRLDAVTVVEDPSATAQAANDVSAPVVELFGRYASGHPVQVGRLDVIGRQIVIDAQRDDLAAARRQVERARSEWRSVRASVIAHGGRAVAGRSDATLARLTAATDRAALVRDARVLLELVDGMERRYKAR